MDSLVSAGSCKREAENAYPSRVQDTRITGLMISLQIKTSENYSYTHRHTSIYTTKERTRASSQMIQFNKRPVLCSGSCLVQSSLWSSLMTLFIEPAFTDEPVISLERHLHQAIRINLVYTISFGHLVQDLTF